MSNLATQLRVFVQQELKRGTDPDEIAAALAREILFLDTGMWDWRVADCIPAFLEEPPK